MWVRNTQCIPPSRLVKMYLWPRGEIHCAYCGNYPGNGIISLCRDLGCCVWQPRVQGEQKTLDALLCTIGDSSSPAPQGRNPRSGTRISTKENPVTVPDALKLAKPNRSASGLPAYTVQSNLKEFCGQ